MRAGRRLRERRVHDGLDGVHAVLGFVEDLGLGGLEDLVSDFHFGDTEFLGDLGADLGFGVVVGGQAVHEYGVGGGFGHDGGGDAVGLEKPDALFPDVVGFAHGNPDVGVDDVGAGDGFVDILGEGDGRRRGGQSRRR